MLEVNNLEFIMFDLAADGPLKSVLIISDFCYGFGLMNLALCENLT